MEQQIVKIGKISIGNKLPFLLIAGPDSLESMSHAMYMAKSIKKICDELKIPYIFKASYDKANRTSIKSFRGVGLDKGMAILKKIKEEVGVPVTTDVHTDQEAKIAAKTVDLIQIPALLSRQTDLITTAAKTKKPINIKKGQFMSPQSINSVIGKVMSVGNKNILVTERGYIFGYNNLVVDMRSLEIMKKFGQPVVFDASHSIQLPSAGKGVSDGQREFIFTLAKAAIAVGISAVFIEVHNNPNKAPVDGPNSLELKNLKKVLKKLKAIDEIVKI